MTGYISDMNGGVWRLPELLGWTVRHGMGDGADSFEVRCFYNESMENPLHSACRFRAEHEGETVFTGVVDEYEASATDRGAVLTINGRSLAALLMDNEAEAAEYWGAGLDFILSRHVTPWGVTELRKKSMAPASRLKVTSGESQWGVLREFCRFCGGVQPRFDRAGVLLLDGSLGDEVSFGPLTPVTGQIFRDTRYGVISEALVKNRGGAATVENAELKARGGSCRRVVSAPRYAAADALRYTGSWQIEQSKRGARSCVLTIAEPFAAFAGDLVSLRWSPLGLTGGFTVLESVTTAGAAGAETRLTLVEEV